MLTETQLINRIRQIVRELGSQQDAAVALGVAPSYLSEVLNGRREPSEKLLVNMRLRLVRRYEEVDQ